MKMSTLFLTCCDTFKASRITLRKNLAFLLTTKKNSCLLFRNDLDLYPYYIDIIFITLTVLRWNELVLSCVYFVSVSWHSTLGILLATYHHVPCAVRSWVLGKLLYFSEPWAFYLLSRDDDNSKLNSWQFLVAYCGQALCQVFYTNNL